MYSEEELLPISGIQHFSYCKRQWALIFLEGIWEDNIFTIQGNILHEKVHDPETDEKLSGMVINRSMPVASLNLGIYGIMDVVEIMKNDTGGTVYPIEYKKGHPKVEVHDKLQLCAQAMCLEEMMGKEITSGFIFYGETRHREKVLIDDYLRLQLKSTLSEMHDLFQSKNTPPIERKDTCQNCSLRNYCLPEIFGKKSSNYIQENVNKI